MASGGQPQWSPGEPHPFADVGSFKNPSLQKLGSMPNPLNTIQEMITASALPPGWKQQQHPDFTNQQMQGFQSRQRMHGLMNSHMPSQMGSPIDPALVSNTVNQLIGEMYPIGMGGMGGGGATGMGNAMGGLGSGLGTGPGHQTPPGLRDAMRANPMGGSFGPVNWIA